MLAWAGPCLPTGGGVGQAFIRMKGRGRPAGPDRNGRQRQDRRGSDQGEGAAMTASGRGRKATADPPAEPEAAPGGAVPQEEQELQQEIEQTREQLGETVEQLAAKADVKGRAQAK